MNTSMNPSIKNASPLARLEEHSPVNLTPMLDVVFIMLIFFIVTAVFVREEGITVPPPNPDRLDAPPAKVPPIVVDVLERRRLLVGGLDVDERLLGAQLTRLHAQAPEAVVVIRPRANSTTEMLVKVMDSARLVGISAISIAEN